MLLFPSLHTFPAARYASAIWARVLATAVRAPPGPCHPAADAHLHPGVAAPWNRSVRSPHPCAPHPCPAPPSHPGHHPPRVTAPWNRSVRSPHPCAPHPCPAPPSHPGHHPPRVTAPWNRSVRSPHPCAPHPCPAPPSHPGHHPPRVTAPWNRSVRSPHPCAPHPCPAPPSHPGHHPPRVTAPWNRSVRSPHPCAPHPCPAPPSHPGHHPPRVTAPWNRSVRSPHPCAPHPCPAPPSHPDPRPALQALHPERSGRAEPPGDRGTASEGLGQGGRSLHPSPRATRPWARWGQDPDHRHDSTDVGNREAPCSGPGNQRAGRPGQEIHGRTLHARKASRTRCLQGQGAFPESELREPRGAERGAAPWPCGLGPRESWGPPGRLPASRKPVAQAQGISTQSKQAAGLLCGGPGPRRLCSSSSSGQGLDRARTPRLVTEPGFDHPALTHRTAGRASRPGCCEPVGCPQQLRDLPSGKRPPTSPPPHYSPFLRSHPAPPAACTCPRPEPPARRGLQT
nr:basic proline-rich protein-like [Vulpes vulpes]